MLLSSSSNKALNITKNQLDLLERALGEYYKDNFYAFVSDWFLTWRNTDFKLHYTVQYLCEYLQATVQGDFERLLVSLPRGWGKSIIISEALPAWVLLRDPTERVGCFSRALTQDAKIWHEASVSILQNERTLKYFPDSNCRLASKSKLILRTKAGGYRKMSSCLSSSVGSDMTIAIIDDPADQEHYRSEAKRMRLQNFFTKSLLRAVRTTVYEDSEEYLSQLTSLQREEYDLMKKLQNENLKAQVNAKKPRLILTMQRLHLEDPIAMFLKINENMKNAGLKSSFNYIKVPAIHEERTEYHFPLSNTVHIANEGEYTLAGTLTREKINEAKVEMQVDDFNAQMQQNPTITQGCLMKGEDFLFYDDMDLKPRMNDIFITCDTATKTREQNDYSVMCCWAWNGERLLLLDMIRGKWEFLDLQKNFYAFYQKWANGLGNQIRLQKIIVEDKSSGTQLIQTAKTLGVPAHLVRAKGRSIDKYSRYAKVGAFISSQKVMLPHHTVKISGVESITEKITIPFLSEVKSYSKDGTHKHDDICDCLFDACEEVYTQVGANKGFRMPAYY